MSASSSLTLLFQIVYMALDRRFLSISQPWVLIFHSLNIALYGVAVIMNVTLDAWVRLHWKVIAFAFSSMMIWSSAAITVLTRQTEPRFHRLVPGRDGNFSLGGEAELKALLSIHAIAAFAAAF